MNQNIKSTTDPKKAYQSVVVISLGLLFSLLAYFVILKLLLGKKMPAFENSALPLETIKNFFFIASMIIIFSIRPIKNALLRAKNPNLATGPFVRLQIVTILSLALAEIIAVFGLILAILSKNIASFYPFFAGSLVLFVLHFPRYSQWQDASQKQG